MRIASKEFHLPTIFAGTVVVIGVVVMLGANTTPTTAHSSTSGTVPAVSGTVVGKKAEVSGRGAPAVYGSTTQSTNYSLRILVPGEDSTRFIVVPKEVYDACAEDDRFDREEGEVGACV